MVNTASVLFDLLGQVGSGEAVGQAGAYLSSALYQLFRQLYRSAGGNEGPSHPCAVGPSPLLSIRNPKPPHSLIRIMKNLRHCLGQSLKGHSTLGVAGH